MFQWNQFLLSYSAARACVYLCVCVCVCVCVWWGEPPMKHHNSSCTSFCDAWSAMTHNMRQCVQNWKDGDLTFSHETQQTTATTPKCWDYCTCSGSCRGVELKGVLFSTLPRIYKHNTISPQRASLRLLHLCYSVSVTYAYTTKWNDWPLGEYFIFPNSLCSWIHHAQDFWRRNKTVQVNLLESEFSLCVSLKYNTVSLFSTTDHPSETGTQAVGKFTE